MIKKFFVPAMKPQVNSMNSVENVEISQRYCLEKVV
jgi:hypothetical protein